jgi:hypothetical protein
VYEGQQGAKSFLFMYGDQKRQLKYQGTAPDCFIRLELYSPYLEGSVAPFVGIVTRNSSNALSSADFSALITVSGSAATPHFFCFRLCHVDRNHFSPAAYACLPAGDYHAGDSHAGDSNRCL